MRSHETCKLQTFQVLLSLGFTLSLLSLPSCSDPQCPPGRVRVGQACIRAPGSNGDGGVEEPGDNSDDSDEEVGSKADAAAIRDARTKDVVTATEDARADGEISADADAPEQDASAACTAEPETCNGEDDDCDGKSDEGASESPIGAACSDGAQGVCAMMGKRICFEGEIKCSAPATAGAEVCDGVDNDCDGQTDEGMLNACGKCGAVPAEVCDGVDNDCDGQTDEGMLNACGKCGAVPAENCSTPGDDDCDGTANEGCCGNGVKDSGEQCDPTAAGYTKFNCTQSCTPSKIYANCVTSEPGGQGNCPSGFVCGAFADSSHPTVSDYCIPRANCPSIPGVTWVMFGDLCVQPCSSSSQCPVPVTYCYPNPLGGAEPEAWCVK